MVKEFYRWQKQSITSQFISFVLAEVSTFLAHYNGDLLRL
jgi:hypothetical protein